MWRHILRGVVIFVMNCGTGGGGGGQKLLKFAWRHLWMVPYPCFDLLLTMKIILISDVISMVWSVKITHREKVQNSWKSSWISLCDTKNESNERNKRIKQRQKKTLKQKQKESILTSNDIIARNGGILGTNGFYIVVINYLKTIYNQDHSREVYSISFLSDFLDRGWGPEFESRGEQKT